MKLPIQVRCLSLIVIAAIIANACTSAEGAAVATPTELPPVFDAATSVPEPTEAATPGSVSEPTEPTASSDELVEPALALLAEVDLAEANPGEILDAGILMDQIQVADRLVTISTCTWHSDSIRPNRSTYRYFVSEALEATLVESLLNGPACVNKALLDSAGEFALEAAEHLFIYSQDPRDPDDPTLADFWHPNMVDDLRQVSQQHLDGFRAIRHAPEDGTPIAWAHHVSPIELVVALRYDYNERYGTYDVRTDKHLVERTPQIAPDDLVGDDHVLSVMLWWDRGRWWTLAIEDLYGIACESTSCIETIEGIGATPDRPIHQTIDFVTLRFNAIEEIER